MLAMDYKIKTIPHREQRYETVGDYYLDDAGVTQVRISDMQNEDYAFLVMIHELIEERLTRKRGIPEAAIKAFDEEFEANRKPGDDSEPGWAPDCPYRKEHAFAENIERMVAHELGVDWEEYDKTAGAL
jgi:hypothetical protein